MKRLIFYPFFFIIILCCNVVSGGQAKYFEKNLMKMELLNLKLLMPLKDVEKIYSYGVFKEKNRKNSYTDMFFLYSHSFNKKNYKYFVHHDIPSVEKYDNDTDKNFIFCVTGEKEPRIYRIVANIKYDPKKITRKAIIDNYLELYGKPDVLYDGPNIYGFQQDAVWQKNGFSFALKFWKPPGNYFIELHAPLNEDLKAEAILDEKNEKYLQAVEKLTQAINLGINSPKNTLHLYYLQRARCYAMAGRNDLAENDYSKILNFFPNKDDVYNIFIYRDLSWQLATYPGEAARNGTLSLDFAKRLKSLHDDNKVLPSEQALLACAHAERSEFQDAANAQIKAMDTLINKKHIIDKVKPLYLKRLKLYQDEKPFRDQIPLRFDETVESW